MHPKDPAALVKQSVVSSLVARQGADYSGQDFGAEVIRCQSFFESIFNGCSLTGIHASQSIFQHTEFTEAQFDGCTFQDSSFDHSDFVLADLRNCRFVRCSFQNAEWRDSVFNNVVFEQCIFRNTTSSLVRFNDCSFDGASAANFVGPSKRRSIAALLKKSSRKSDESSFSK